MSPLLQARMVLYGKQLSNFYVSTILLLLYVTLMAAEHYLKKLKKTYLLNTYPTLSNLTTTSIRIKSKKLKYILTLLFQYIFLLKLFTLVKKNLV
jgi:hypothetical protein